MSPTINRSNFSSLLLLTILLVGISSAALAQQPPVVVKTYGQHVGGNIVYQQQITNNSNRDVMTVTLAEDTDQMGITGGIKDSGELKAFPVGSDMIHTKVNPASISGPTGWAGSVIQIQDSGLVFEWRRPPYPQLPLQPGQTLHFSITVPTFDQAYLTGHFSAGYGDGNDPWYYNGVMEKLDTIPPTLSVALNPATLWPPDHKLVAVTADITVKDDYDPAPEVQLVSITANEALDRDDVREAKPGTDSRKFLLRAERGIVYTVTYAATDGSGNKSTASATVTVPRDREDREQHESLRNKHSQQEGGMLMNPLSR
jgi:hypothetical protein